MFDFLKKKITDFTDKLKEKLQEKKPETQEIPLEKVPEKPAQKPIEKKKAETKTQKITEKKEKKKKEKKSEAKEEIALETETPEEISEEVVEPEQEEIIETEETSDAEEFDTAGEKKEAEEKIKEVRGEEKRELKAKVGFFKKITGFIGGKIKISENETKEFFEEFELSLLESDVEQETAEAIVKELKERIVGKEISSKENVSEFLKQEVRESLKTVMETQKIELLKMKQKPIKILFIGPNGAGKTTSIAKIAKYFLNNKKTVIIAAGDTFRAAAIEQLQEHADKLGVKLVKHNYGADPAAVGFDAVKMAEAKGIDVVLIDSAGRQDTNKNLLEEMKKIERVVKPDLKLYVGEAYTGQALLEQVEEFDKAINLDGFVLTKIDTDTKGGTAISLLHKFKKPILFVGTGQRYEDLLEFKPEFIIDRIL
ncbi:MAG TPA: signal recognition particle-docking protein FtsY [archaeon]|nr:signal recognition particle-docking protein FtsY [archaeon]